MSFLMFLLAVGLVAWFAASWKAVGPAQVGIILFFGKPEVCAHKSGLVFVPWVPFKWSGLRPWELVRIPTKQFPFRYEGKEEHRVWSSDKQSLVVEVSGYIRFPYDEPDSLVTMIKAGVPCSQESLQEWVEEEVIAGLRDIMAGFTLEQTIQRSNLTAINDAAKVYFLRPDGLFAKSGICGNDPTNYTPGTGEVILRVEQVNPTAEIQKAMGAQVAAKYRADAARETARMNTEEISRQILGIVADQYGMTIEQLMQDLKDHPDKRGKSTKEGGYKETFAFAEDMVKRDRAAEKGDLADVRVGASDGTPLQGDLAGLANLAGIVTGVRKVIEGKGGPKGGGKQGNRGRNAAPEKDVLDMDEQEQQEWAEQRKKSKVKKD